MTGDDLRRRLDAALEVFVSSADELRDLDAATGDGDLGVTVRGGVAAAQAALSSLEPGASPADVVRAVASAIARSNPATFSTLSASALLAAAEAAASGQAAFDVAVDAAREGVDATTTLVARRGRAAWIGERGRGHPDAGATAYLRFLEAIGSV
jgi:phosphoenolpyruvate---glycerone phosphotransferase subunit DhaL